MNEGGKQVHKLLEDPQDPAPVNSGNMMHQNFSEHKECLRVLALLVALPLVELLPAVKEQSEVLLYIV